MGFEAVVQGDAPARRLGTGHHRNKTAAGSLRICQRRLDHCDRIIGYQGITVQKAEDVAAGPFCPSIHLGGPSRLGGLDNYCATGSGNGYRVVTAAAIHHQHFCTGRL